MTDTLLDLCRFNTTTTGTGAITVGSPVAGYRTPAQAGGVDGQIVTYAIRDGSNSETDRGTLSSSGTVLSRTPLQSTNANSAISLTGSAEVFVTAIAENIVVNGGGFTSGTVPMADGATGTRALKDSHIVDDGSRITVSYNSSTLPAALTGTVMRLAGVTGAAATRAVLDGYGGTIPQLIGFAVGGTPAAMSATVSGQVMLATNVIGHDGSAVTGGRGGFRVIADATWVPGSHPTRLDWQVTSSGSTAAVTVGGVGSNGGMMIPLNLAVLNDEGPGTVNVLNGYYINNVNIKGNLPATGTNDDAIAGNVGQCITATMPDNTPVTINTTSGFTTITNVTLTPGDWDVEGFVGIYLTAATYSDLRTRISDNANPPATLTTAGALTNMFGPQTVGSSYVWVRPVGRTRVQVLASTTMTMLLEVMAINGGFTSAGAFGRIEARRVR